VTIAFVSDAIYPYNKGGKEKRLFELSTRLAAMGHEVHIYCMKWWDGPKDRTEHGVQLHAISKLYPLYKGDRRSIKEGIFFGTACLRLINKKFDVLDVDHMPFFPIFSAWFVCVLRGKKLNGTWHEALKRKEWTEYMGIMGNIAALIERLSVRLPARITVASEHTKKTMLSELKRSKQMYVVSPGINVEEINSAKIGLKKCDVLFVGRLVKDKNVALLVRATSKLVTRNPNIKCLIVGTGIEKGNILKLIRENQLSKNVEILDRLPKASDIYACMKAAKVFVLPSSREGFGIVALEALACGTPVVTTNSTANAAKELVVDNVTGSIVDPDEVSLAMAIDKWLHVTPNTASMKELAVEYDWQASALKQEKVYAI
jgi:glycosyltransferase involved in cell wall biosynthesis